MALALPQCSHITRKRGVYYFRRRLPHPLRGEVALSLRTRQYREAEYLSEALTNRWNQVIGEAMLDQARLSEILRRELDRLLSEGRERIIATPYGKPAFVGGFSGSEREALQADLDAMDCDIKQMSSDLARRDLRGPESVIRKVMAENGVPAEDFQRFGLAWFRVYIEALKKRRSWLENGPFDLDDITSTSPPSPMVTTLVAQSTSPASASVEPSAPNLSMVLPGFVDLMVSTGEWTGQTEKQNTATYRMFMAVCGDRPITTYSRKDCATFFDVLRGLPSLYSKKPEWAKLSLPEIAQQTKGMDVERLAMKTIKRHFAALGRLFDHLRKRGEITGENPAHGFDFPVGKARANEGRQMWEGDKLKALFLSPVWTGCASGGRRSTPGDVIIRDEKFWLPLLGLYHGNRLEEFAQLLRSDLRQEDGIWFLDINDEQDKQVKNAQSRRRVPLHPRLEAMGFIQYVDQIARAPGDRVFPQLKPGGPDRKLGYYFSKWFSRYRQSVGVYEEGLDYHSFRHGVTTKLFGAGVDKVVVDALTGHEGQGISEKVYLKGLPLTRLYEAVCKVEWPELSDLLLCPT